MELALNLVWVGVALLGFVLLGANLSRASGRPGRQPSKWQKIMAMSCALIILFFVISMTDDLHDQQMAVEESRSLQVTSEGASPSRASAHAHAIVTPFFLLFFAAARCSFSLSAERKLLEPLEVSFTAGISRKSLRGRAPPASLA
jgi:hypothetical protein